jgi:hypothetical protein
LGTASTRFIQGTEISVFNNPSALQFCVFRAKSATDSGMKSATDSGLIAAIPI